jgi:hypothetical protein
MNQHTDWANKIKANPKEIFNVPTNHLSNDLCRLAIEHSTDPAIYQYAVQADPFLITAIPQDKITREMCEQCIKNYGNMLNYIPEQYRDEQLYLLATKNCAWALEHIPQDKITREMCKNALESPSNSSISISSIPTHLFDKELCELIITIHPQHIATIPISQCDYNLYARAIEADESTIAFVPRNFLGRPFLEILASAK